MLLGSFVLITIFLALILWALISIHDRRTVQLVPGWQTASAEGYTFQYPASLTTQYINVLDWPPKLEVQDQKMTCSNTSRRIAGHDYCITALVEGAAGSTYTQYAYAREEDDKTFTLSFSTRAPQCGNYPEPEMSQCQAEEDNFDLDLLVDKIAETITHP